MKEIAPGAALRTWYAHKEGQWEEFKKRYFEELKNKSNIVQQLLDVCKDKKVTLLYASRNEVRINAHTLLVILKKS